MGDIISPAVALAHLEPSASKNLQSQKKDDGSAPFGIESSNLVVSMSPFPSVIQGPRRRARTSCDWLQRWVDPNALHISFSRSTEDLEYVERGNDWTSRQEIPLSAPSPQPCTPISLATAGTAIMGLKRARDGWKIVQATMRRLRNVGRMAFEIFGFGWRAGFRGPLSLLVFAFEEI